MELAFEQKQQSCLKRTAHLSLAQEQTQELIIPDSMPDAARTLICYAEPEVQSKTNREGSLLVTGTLRASCLYADDTGALQLLTSELPFTVKLESAELREKTQTLVRCCVRSADSRLINSRKVLLRVTVLVQADGYEPQTQSTSVLADPPACLQLKIKAGSAEAHLRPDGLRLRQKQARPGIFPKNGVGRSGIQIDQAAALLHGDQVPGGLSPRVLPRRQPDGGAGQQKLPAAAGIFHMDRGLLPLQQDLRHKAVWPGEKDRRRYAGIVHRLAILSFGRGPSVCRAAAPEKKKKRPRDPRGPLVDDTGIEPVTSCTSNRRSSQVS